MKKIFIIIGFVLFVLLGVIMKQSINKNMVAINLYYDEVKENTSPEESKKQMEIYLKNHRKKYLIKDIVSDTVSVSVKFWYGITISYLFTSEQFD